MAQLERPQRHGDAEAAIASEQRRLAANATMEHYLRGTDLSRSSPTALSSPTGIHDADEHHDHNPKKSVLTKVKEKAKKLKQSLSNVNKKKHHDNDSHDTDNITPSWSANLNDNEEEEEDAEYLGAPMYKSETAPQGYKDTANKATPAPQNNELNSPSSRRIVAESVITKLPNEIFTGIVLTRTLSTNESATGTTATKYESSNKHVSETSSNKPRSLSRTVSEITPNKPHSPSKAVTETGTTNTPSPKKTITETVTEMLGAGYATVSEKLGTGYATVSEKLGTGYNIATEKLGTGYNVESEKLGTGYNVESEKLGTGYNAASEKLGTGYNAASEKLGPAYATVSDATQAIASKIESLTVSPPYPTRRENTSSRPDPSRIQGLTITAPPPSQSFTAHEEAPQALSASAIERMSKTRAGLQGPQPSSAPAAHGKTAEQRWDKGVSVKEYFIHKFEPGEDERALSQVISDVMSPRKGPGEAGVVEKVKGAITSFLRNEDSSPRTPRSTTISQSPLSLSQPALSPKQSSLSPSKAALSPKQTSLSPVIQPALNLSPRIPVSTNAYEVVEEENKGRVLQAN